METKRLIYSLNCPFTNETHYIGKSTEGMIRPLKHLCESHSEKIKIWVNDLKELGHSPKIEILETVSLSDDLDQRERYWIQYKINKGCLLLNSNLISPLTINPNLDKILTNGEEKVILKIGKFIKEARKKVGLTQDEFAIKSGVSLKTLRKIEQGYDNFNISSLLQILKMFGCTLEVNKIKSTSNKR